MPKLLEEVRHMMPGRARAHWTLTESEDLDRIFDEIGGMVGRLNRAQPKFHAYLHRLTGFGKWESFDASMTHGARHRPFGSYAHLSLTLNHKEGEVARMYRLDFSVSPKHEDGSREYYVGMSGLVRRVRPGEPPQQSWKTDAKTEAWHYGTLRGRQADKYDDPSIVLKKVGPEIKKWNRMQPMGQHESVELDESWEDVKPHLKKKEEESVAGAPGAFAFTDHPAYLDDQTADLLDRVHNPRWEYPTWALPKVQLDEGAESAAMKKAARLSRLSPAHAKKVQKLMDKRRDPRDIWGDIHSEQGTQKGDPGLGAIRTFIDVYRHEMKMHKAGKR